MCSIQKQRLLKFKGLYDKHFGTRLTLQQAEQKLHALVRLLSVVRESAALRNHTSNMVTGTSTNPKNND